MSSRTNLKLQLQREQAQRDDDRKGSSTGSLNSNDGFSSSLNNNNNPSPAQFSSSPLRSSPLMRHSSNSPSSSMSTLSSTAPSMSDFHQQYNNLLNHQQPTARLENPTKFFMEEKQRKHMQNYLSNSLGRQSPLASKSIPTQLTFSNSRSLSQNNASPISPLDSPMTPHSIGTPHSPAITDVSEMDELIDDIMELESKSGTPTSRHTRSAQQQQKDKYKSSSPVSTNLVGNTDYLRMLDPITGKLMPSVSSSCPANLVLGPPSETYTEEGDSNKGSNKDRQKKDNHNIIERKRRDNINNLIKELRTMLPHSSDPSKGSTLKATVDYLKELKKDRDRLKVLEERQKTADRENRKLAMKVQELENLVEAHGIQLPMGQSEMSGISSLAPHLSALITGRGSPQQDSYPGTPTHHQQQQQNNNHYSPQHQNHQQQQNNHYVQIKQEAQSPIPQAFPQYMNMHEDFAGINFGVSDLVNMMDTTDLDPIMG